MEQQLKSAFDELGDEVFVKIARDRTNSIGFQGMLITPPEQKELKIEARMTARFAVNELMELAKGVDVETMKSIVGNTLQSFFVPPEIALLQKDFSPEVRDEYTREIREFNTQFIIKHIAKLDLESLLGNIITWISRGYLTADFIDAMKLDIEAPEKFRHNELREGWTGIDKSEETSNKKPWNLIDEDSKILYTVGLIAQAVSKKAYRKALEYCLDILKSKAVQGTDMEDSIALKAVLLDVRSKSKTMRGDRTVNPEKYVLTSTMPYKNFVKSYAFIKVRNDGLQLKLDAEGKAAMESLAKTTRDKTLTTLIDSILIIYGKF